MLFTNNCCVGEPDNDEPFAIIITIGDKLKAIKLDRSKNYMHSGYRLVLKDFDPYNEDFYFRYHERAILAISDDQAFDYTTNMVYTHPFHGNGNQLWSFQDARIVCDTGYRVVVYENSIVASDYYQGLDTFMFFMQYQISDGFLMLQRAYFANAISQVTRGQKFSIVFRKNDKIKAIKIDVTQPFNQGGYRLAVGDYCSDDAFLFTYSENSENEIRSVKFPNQVIDCWDHIIYTHFHHGRSNQRFTFQDGQIVSDDGHYLTASGKNVYGDSSGWTFFTLIPQY